MGQPPSKTCVKITADNCVDEYLIDFYGPSALWYGIIQFIFNIFIILSDCLFIYIFSSSSTLRKTPANWLLVGLILTDCFHYIGLAAGTVALLVGYIQQAREHTVFCQITGAFIITTASCSFGFPGLIAAQRYYKISYLPTIYSKTSLARSAFSGNHLIPLMIVWYVFSVAINLPLAVYFHSFGEDSNGYCGVKPFTESLPFAIFILATFTVFFLSYILTGIYYYRLGRFLKGQRTSSTNQDSIRFTRSLMSMTKIIVILPLFTMTPTVFLATTQWMLPDVFPMWLKRLVCSFYYIPACFTPWVAIYNLQPFRTRFRELCCNRQQ